MKKILEISGLARFSFLLFPFGEKGRDQFLPKIEFFPRFLSILLSFYLGHSIII